MVGIVKHNEGFRYLLTCIDCFSKYAWVVPLKNKGSIAMCEAVRKLLVQANPRRPQRLQTDKGTEFLNKDVQKLLKAKGIHHFSTNSETKAAIVERFNRTLKTRMWKYFTANNTWKYLDILPELVRAYNHSMHKTIGMCPADVRPKHQNGIWRRMYGQEVPTPKPKVVTGNQVRISKSKNIFDKGYLPNWTEEHFEVCGTEQRHPRVYKLKDIEGEPIEGIFYKEEIQKINKPEDAVYRAEKVLRRRTTNGKKEVFVKWKGWPDKFNSWILETDLVL